MEITEPDDAKSRPSKPTAQLERGEKVVADERPREGGQWKGKVHIADDFDELPDDIASAFGIGRA